MIALILTVTSAVLYVGRQEIAEMIAAAMYRFRK
jgi:hypothetical protein